MAQKSTTYTQSFAVFFKYIYAGKKKLDCTVFFISIVLIMYDVFLLVNSNDKEMLLLI